MILNTLSNSSVGKLGKSKASIPSVLRLSFQEFNELCSLISASSDLSPQQKERTLYAIYAARPNQDLACFIRSLRDQNRHLLAKLVSELVPGKATEVSTPSKTDKMDGQQELGSPRIFGKFCRKLLNAYNSTLKGDSKAKNLHDKCTLCSCFMQRGNARGFLPHKVHQRLKRWHNLPESEVIAQLKKLNPSPLLKKNEEEKTAATTSTQPGVQGATSGADVPKRKRPNKHQRQREAAKKQLAIQSEIDEVIIAKQAVKTNYKRKLELDDPQGINILKGRANLRGSAARDSFQFSKTLEGLESRLKDLRRQQSKGTKRKAGARSDANKKKA